MGRSISVPSIKPFLNVLLLSDAGGPEHCCPHRALHEAVTLRAIGHPRAFG